MTHKCGACGLQALLEAVVNGDYSDETWDKIGAIGDTTSPVDIWEHLKEIDRPGPLVVVCCHTSFAMCWDWVNARLDHLGYTPWGG